MISLANNSNKYFLQRKGVYCRVILRYVCIMIGLVVVTHGHLASELIDAMEHVMGPQEKVMAICIGANDDMDQRSSDILNAAKTVSTKDPTKAKTPVIFEIFKSKPYPRSQSKCLNSFKI